MHPVVFVVGPTACGKSQVALDLARHYSGGILNCDSLQIYQRLDIGTAKPTAAEMNEVPHYLFNALAPGAVLTAGDFRTMALAELKKNLEHRMIFAVGGSGFYIQALEKGMFEVEKADPVIDAQVRAQLAEFGPEKLHEQLRKLDPESAEEINPNDAYRIMRALVVIHGSGKKMSDLKKEFQPKPFPFPYIKLGLSLDREQLLPKVEQRVRAMLAAGFLEEVAGLLKDGFGRWPALQSVGYKECAEHLTGKLAEDQLIPQIIEKTMQLAKKQRTWFKRDASIHWLKSENPLAEAIQCVKKVK